MQENIIIRIEREADFSAVYEINSKAFETTVEALLVNKLRKSGIPLISLVSELDDKLVGHILFSQAHIISENSRIEIMALAPMAVLPEYQGQSIGSELVKHGLKLCIQNGFKAVAVLGHPEYYPRFGFEPSINLNISCSYDVPEEVFMIMELKRGFLKNVAGQVEYHKLFNELA